MFVRRFIASYLKTTETSAGYARLVRFSTEVVAVFRSVLPRNVMFLGLTPSRVRWPEGMVCGKCGKTDLYPRITTRRMYQCRSCLHFNSPTAGTIFHKTRTSLQCWFLAIFLIASDKRGYSALLLSKQIGVDYDTAWAMLQRIRHAMAQRDKQYQLSGSVEMDELFMGTPTVGRKRGRG